ncbi:MAG: glycosyl hydrolase family 8 [Acidimicrobiales bacterium]
MLAVVVVAGGIAALSMSGRLAGRPSPAALARRDASAFLARYVAPDGRVVRTDQGGTTVSEGEGYALLLAVAIGDRSTFARVWKWEERHLQLRDGLFAYLWRHGSVENASPAADADLDTAWALVLAGRRFGDPRYTAAGSRVATSILSHETVTVPTTGTAPGRAGSVELVAGPWGRRAPFTVNPSYLSPEAMAALARLTGQKTWDRLEVDSLALLGNLQHGEAGGLLPDWATVSSTGEAQPSGSESGSGSGSGSGSAGRPTYGLTAERVAVWYAADCSARGRAIAAAMWRTLRGLRSRGGRTAYSLDGTALARTVNPLGYVASAAAAYSGGHEKAGLDLLARADRQNSRFHTYYGGAWTALGRVLLDTTWLSSCPPGQINRPEAGRSP